MIVPVDIPVVVFIFSYKCPTINLLDAVSRGLFRNNRSSCTSDIVLYAFFIIVCVSCSDNTSYANLVECHFAGVVVKHNVFVIFSKIKYNIVCCVILCNVYICLVVKLSGKVNCKVVAILTVCVCLVRIYDITKCILSCTVSKLNACYITDSCGVGCTFIFSTNSYNVFFTIFIVNVCFEFDGITSNLNVLDWPEYFFAVK